MHTQPVDCSLYQVKCSTVSLILGIKNVLNKNICLGDNTVGNYVNEQTL